MRVALSCLVVSCAALAAAGCCVDPVDQSRYFCFGEVSDAEEVELGAQFAPSFMAEGGGQYPDPALSGYLRGIVIDKMARHSQRADLPWTFELLNSSTINAFALPGGKVYVTRGLLALLESEAQFAILMGHEIGHVTHRHALRGQGRRALLGVLTGALALVESANPLRDRDDPLWIAGTVGAVGSIATLKFSRDQELQSDERGIDYASFVGYEPTEGPKTFETFLALKEKSGQKESMLDGLLSTHPLDSDRIDAMKSYTSEKFSGTGTEERTRSTPAWAEQMERLRKAHEVYKEHDGAMQLVVRAAKEKNAKLLDDAEAILRKCASSLSGHGRFPLGLALIALERTTPSDALTHSTRACELEPELFEAHFLRGIALGRLARAKEALAELKTAHGIHPMSPQPCLALGDLEEASGNLREAERWFQMALDRSPPGSELRKVARARLDRLGRGAA